MMRMEMCWERRPAIYRPNKYRAYEMGVPENAEVSVDVLGLFQYSNEEVCDAYFIVETSDGKCWYAGVREIQFMDKEADHVTNRN